MNKDEIEAMGKFFRQAFDMSNGSPPDVKYEMTQKAKDALKEMDKRIDKLVAYDCDLVTRVDAAVKRGTEGRRKLKDDILNIIKDIRKLREDLANRISMLEEEYKNDLKRLRGDYRSLQNEMWERFDLVEEWILSDKSSEKQKLKADIIEVREDHERQKNYTMFKKEKKVTPMDLQHRGDLKYARPQIWNTSIKNLKSEQGLELSIRSVNTLWNANIRTVGELIQKAPSDLLKIKSFGRKCLHEVKQTLESHKLTLNMEKEEKLKQSKKDKIIKMFKL
jgi:hypothetical protein